jgi:hypothetical protein
LRPPTSRQNKKRKSARDIFYHNTPKRIYSIASSLVCLRDMYNAQTLRRTFATLANVVKS